MKPFELFTSDIILLYYIQAGLIFLLVFIFYIFNKYVKIYFILKAIDFVELFLIIICFAFVGTTLGLMIGASKSPVVGVFIPTLLSFLSGFVAYLFVTKKAINTRTNRVYVSVSIIVLSFFVVIGASKGASERYNDEYEKNQEEKMYKLKEKELDFKLKLMLDDMGYNEIFSDTTNKQINDLFNSYKNDLNRLKRQRPKYTMQFECTEF